MAHLPAGKQHSSGGGSKVIGYDASQNGAAGTFASVGASPSTNYDKHAIDAYDGVLAAVYRKTGGDFYLNTGTVSGTALTKGTEISLGSVNNDSGATLVLASDKIVCAYRKTVGSARFQLKTFDLAAGVLSLDVTLNAEIVGGSTNCFSLARVSDTRFVALYLNSSGYPSVLGFTVGAGSLTADASPTVIESNSVSSGASFAIRFIGSGKLLACYGKSSDSSGYRSIITDGGTSTSAATPVQITDDSSTSIAMIAGASGGVATSGDTGGAYLFAASAGSIDSERKSTSGDTFKDLALITPPVVEGQATSDLQGALFGDVDGDGKIWGAWPVLVDAASATIMILFFGFDPEADPVDESFIQALRTATTAATGVREGSMKMVALDSNTFFLFWLNSSGDYKYIIGKIS